MLQLAITEQNSEFTQGELYYKTQYIGDVVFLSEYRPKAGEYLVRYMSKNQYHIEVLGDVGIATSEHPNLVFGAIGTEIGYKNGKVVAINPKGVAEHWHSIDNSRVGDETLLLVFDLRRALI